MHDLDYERQVPRDRRLTVASWLALAVLLLTCAVVPGSYIFTGIAYDVLGWVANSLFCGLVFFAGLNLVRWSRCNWSTGGADEKLTAGMVCAVLLFYVACMGWALADAIRSTF